MARSKRSPALFEVIHANRRGNTTPASALRTPTWWFKGRSSGIAPVQREITAPVPAPSTEPVPTPVASPSQPRASRSTLQCRFDPERQELTLKVHYTLAVVAGFALFMLIALAYVAGRRAGGNPAGLASSAGSIMRLPPEPGALDVGQSSSSHPAPLAAITAAPAFSALHVEGQPAPAVPGVGVDINQSRSVGLNYIIVQSYPNQKDATAARDFLVKEGIPCTVEKSPHDWIADSNWFSVITVAGFQHLHSQEYETASRTIAELGEKFANAVKFKRFEPHPYKWKQS